MAPGDRRPDRLPLPLLLLLWIVTSSMFSTGLCSGEEFSVCNTRCCSVTPNCSDALQVSCDCHDERQVALRRGDFPASVQSICIKRVRQVVIYENALLDLTSLVKVELQKIDKLTVHPHGLALQKNASLFTFDVDTVKELTVESSAFSGFWERGTRINIRHISKLYIQENAFSFQSLHRSPSLNIEAAYFLDMDSKAFNAPLTSLTLRAVNTPLCKRNTFSGIVRSIEMKQAKIKKVEEGCINGTGDLNWLSMSSCSLGTIHSRGICGEIRKVKIHNSKVTTVQTNGFQLQVGSLDIAGSEFKYLKSRGLNVRANVSIYLSNATVHVLSRHALIALQVDSRMPMVIHDLNVSHAEKGSLTFDKAVDLELNHLSVRAPEHPVCPTSMWVRWLTGTDESEPLSQRDQQILAEINREWLCQENSHTATSPQMTTDDPVTATEQTVTVKPSVQDHADQTAEEDESVGRTTPAPPHDKWLVPVLQVLIVVVFLTICIACLKLIRSYNNETESNKRSGTNPFSGSNVSSSSEHVAITLTDSASKKNVRKRKNKTVGSNKS